jgi:hypothetical protein
MQASPDIVPIMAGDCDTVGLGRAAVGCIAVAADRSGNGIITNIDIRRFDANQREPSEMRSWVRQIEPRGDSRTYPFASVKACIDDDAAMGLRLVVVKASRRGRGAFFSGPLAATQ